MQVVLNVESKLHLGNKELQDLLMQCYNDRLAMLVKIPCATSDEGAYYVIKYDDHNGIDQVIKNIKFLCCVLVQDAIACIISTDYMHAKIIITSNNVLKDEYNEFRDEFFTTDIDAIRLVREGKAYRIDGNII